MLFTTAEGLVSFEEIQKHLDKEASDHLLGYREIIDASNASTNVTLEEVRHLVARLQTIAHRGDFGPTALVTTNDVVFGMGMMASVLSELRGGPAIGVFRSFDKGLDWLVQASRR
jgi:hypothetical protein